MTNAGAIFDRFILALVIIHGVFVICFSFILQLSAVWNNILFVSMLIIVIIVDIVFMFCLLYFGEKRKLHSQMNETDWNLLKVSFGVAILHILFIFVWIYRTRLYSTNPMIFAGNYDSGFIKQYFNEDKFYFTGNYERMNQCPKEITVFNWEDTNNPLAV